MSRFSGVGRFSVLAQGTLDEYTTDTNVGVKKSVGSRGLPVTFEEAQNESGTGRYQIVLLLVCGLVNMACAISTTAVSFIVPVAEKDFNMSTINKAMLNGAPFLGMIFGSYFWGICGDMKGRRFVILGSMGMDALFAILSCLTQHLLLFFIFRVLNGFAIIGATCMIYVYLGEFLTPDKRDSYLLGLEIFWALGMIVGPGIAMIVIPSNINLLHFDNFTINAWRVFICLTSIPSLIAFILIYLYPETPRYLMLRGQMVLSRDILERIYFVNNKNTTEPYSVESFTQTFSAVGFNTEFIRGMPFLKNFKTRLMALKRGHKALFSGYFRNIAITCTIEFCLMFSYTSILVWIPELFSRYYDFVVKNEESANICTASDWLKKFDSKSAEKLVSSDTYLVALIVATSTLPLITLTGIMVKYLNKKILLWISCGIPILAALLITITKNGFQAKILCCIFEGFTTLTEPILFCTIVELFPSNVRGVAFSMIVMTGRLGAMFGIFIFGELIDRNCLMAFYLLAILLLTAFIAVAFLPKLKIGGGH